MHGSLQRAVRLRRTFCQELHCLGHPLTAFSELLGDHCSASLAPNFTFDPSILLISIFFLYSRQLSTPSFGCPTHCLTLLLRFACRAFYGSVTKEHLHSKLTSCHYRHPKNSVCYSLAVNADCPRNKEGGYWGKKNLNVCLWIPHSRTFTLQRGKLRIYTIPLENFH